MPRWSAGPILVSGLASLASDILFLWVAIHGEGRSTDVVVSAIALFLQVQVILPVCLMWGGPASSGVSGCGEDALPPDVARSMAAAGSRQGRIRWCILARWSASRSAVSLGPTVLSRRP